MGRKAKLKKIRKQQSDRERADSKQDTDNFIDRIQRQGYQFDRALEGPELPRQKIDPQV